MDSAWRQGLAVADGKRQWATIDQTALEIAHLEQVLVSAHGFGRAQEQMTSRMQCPSDLHDDFAFAFLRKIDQDIAAEDHIEPAQLIERLQQIEGPKTHALTTTRQQLDAALLLAKIAAPLIAAESPRGRHPQ